ncbi:hypothetical protein LR48_Vigan02g063000 [Vigna angularis]|uniref:Uncharacterized protein n=1 Tax=Phaseolus angularis TaxID=3914 RepID=A0A0L9TVB4_PHAAN|nr:hypothetical protein LR48_Vigan02g063000 [Vigna angularis]
MTTLYCWRAAAMDSIVLARLGIFEVGGGGSDGLVGGYPDTLIIIQSQVEKDELCSERVSYVVRGAGGPGLCAGFGHSVED